LAADLGNEIGFFLPKFQATTSSARNDRISLSL